MNNKKTKYDSSVMLRKLTGSSNRSHDTPKTNMAATVRTICITTISLRFS